MITASIITVLVAMTVNPTTVPVFEVVNDLPAPIEAVETTPEAPAEDAEPPSEVKYVEEWYWEPQWQVYGVTADYDVSYDAYWTESVVSYDTGDGISAIEFQWLGVVSDESHTYTWYSERVLPGGGLDDLNANGRHSDGGFVKDGDGYIAVASCDYEKGTVIDTPFGQAKVYDTGYLAPGQVDVYTSF